jgi:hypothetical protein
VHIFTLDTVTPTNNATWRQRIAHGTSGITLQNSDLFGGSVALNGTGSIVAVAATNSDTGGTDRGEVYLLGLNTASLATAPTYGTKLAYNRPYGAQNGLVLTASDYFGESVALNNAGNILAVGAMADDTGGTDRGAVYLFDVNTSDVSQTPTFRYKMTHGNSSLTLANSDFFGRSLSLNGAGDSFNTPRTTPRLIHKRLCRCLCCK